MHVNQPSESGKPFRLLPRYGIYLRMRHGGALGFDFPDVDKLELARAAFLSLGPTKRQVRKFDRLCASLERVR